MEAVDVPGRGVHHPHAVQMGEGALAAAQPAGQQLETGLNILQTHSFEEQTMGNSTILISVGTNIVILSS